MKFIKMYNVKNNRELKKVNNNVILEIKTRNTEDLLDINRQIWRLEKKGYKVVLQSPKGNLLPSRALGKYTKYHVNVEVPMDNGKVNMIAFKAKLNNLKSMMSHRESVTVTQYEKSYSVFDTPQPLEETINSEKIVYANRLYTFSINGKYVNNYKFIKRLAKSYKIPLATVIHGEIIDPRFDPEDNETLKIYLEGFNDKSKDIFIKTYREKRETIGHILQKYFGCTHPSNEFEGFAYSLYNYIQFYNGDYDMIDHRVDATAFRDDMHTLTNDLDKAELLLEEIAKKGFAFNLEGFPELMKYSIDNYHDNTPNEDILD